MLIGGDEIASGELTLKDMQSGEQKKMTALAIMDLLK
ncbi:hypothetical protein [Pedobacter sp.]